MTQRKLSLKIIENIIQLYPEFSELPRTKMIDIVEKHIFYTVSELAVFQKQLQPKKEEEYKKNNPLKIRVTIDTEEEYKKYNPLKIRVPIDTEEEYKKNNPLKIRVTIDTVEQGYHIQAWHNGVVLTGYISTYSATPNKNFIKTVEGFSDALLAEVIYPKTEEN